MQCNATGRVMDVMAKQLNGTHRRERNGARSRSSAAERPTLSQWRPQDKTASINTKPSSSTGSYRVPEVNLPPISIYTHPTPPNTKSPSPTPQPPNPYPQTEEATVASWGIRPQTLKTRTLVAQQLRTADDGLLGRGCWLCARDGSEAVRVQLLPLAGAVFGRPALRAAEVEHLLRVSGVILSRLVGWRVAGGRGGEG